MTLRLVVASASRCAAARFGGSAGGPEIGAGGRPPKHPTLFTQSMRTKVDRPTSDGPDNTPVSPRPSGT